ncbi:MAG: sugar phosphate nucleotidyltransferase [Bacteroidales bacterium]|jgi:NDP-sugar pyrophosphorylase family protein|nr:sugar phosphate nucleotidyltransferase [Bacteroidales bacterium]
MKPALLILAAGIGSRYGGLKQLDPIGPSGETIIDYSIYDAKRAGFGKIVFIIKESIEQDFKETFVEKLKDKIAIDYVFQETWMVPDGIAVPENRLKPWGTGHAVMMAEDKIDSPFAVINADDFYSRGAFKTVASYYRHWSPARENDYCMVGYPLAATLSEFGSVSRGVCQVNENAYLINVVERTHIERQAAEVVYKNESGQVETISPDTLVSMNFWGFTPSFFAFLRQGFAIFIKDNRENQKAEFYIPSMVNDLIHNQKVSVKVLGGAEQWFGMTYKEDRGLVVKKIRELVKNGVYPGNLWA